MSLFPWEENKPVKLKYLKVASATSRAFLIFVLITDCFVFSDFPSLTVLILPKALLYSSKNNLSVNSSRELLVL